MKTSDLDHRTGVIQCKCGEMFEVSRRELADPHRLLQRKEKIASRHVCRPKRVQSVRPVIRMWMPPSGAALQIYYSNAMRRMGAAQA
jgi:hypothetical protein